MGAMDGFLVAVRDRFAPGERLFRDGFGDVVATCAAYGSVLERIRRGSNPLADFRPVFRVASPRAARPPPPQSGCTACRRTRHSAAVEKEKLERGPSLHDAASRLFESELAYESPWSAHLPSEVGTARALWLSASPHSVAFKATVAGSDGAGAESSLAADAAAPSLPSSPSAALTALSPSAIVLHMPAFGEEGYGSRKDCARALALEDNAINLILMAPFYGERRRAGQASSSPLTVADMIAQSFAISMEAAALIRWAAGRWPRAKLLVTGFSYGGAMTGTGGTFAAACLPPADRARLGVVPCIGSCSPVVLLEGVLRSSVGWEALERSQPSSSSTTRSAPPIAGTAAGARKEGTAPTGCELSAALLPAAADATAAGAAPATASASAAARSPVPLPVMACSDRAELARLLQAPAIVAAHDVPSLLHAVLAGVRLSLLLDIVIEGSTAAAAASAGATSAGTSAAAPAAGAGAWNPRHLFGAVSSVAAAHDEFVRPRFTLEQHACLASAVSAPHAATIVTVGGGHVAAFVRRKALFVPAVRRALAILNGSAAPT